MERVVVLGQEVIMSAIVEQGELLVTRLSLEELNGLGEALQRMSPEEIQEFGRTLVDLSEIFA